MTTLSKLPLIADDSAGYLVQKQSPSIDVGTLDSTAVGTHLQLTSPSGKLVKLNTATVSTSGALIATSGAFTTGTVSTTPSSANDIANKAYVDGVAQGLSVKQSCRVASTANIASLSTTTSVDGVSLLTGDRVLVWQQASGVENGIYEFNGTGLARASDMAAGSHASGTFTFIEQGTYSAHGYVCTTVETADTVGTNALTFTQFSGAGTYSAGNGISIAGTTIAAVADQGISVSGSGITVALNGATLAKSGSGLSVAGVPLNFTINGITTGSTVTAANLGTLTDGNHDAGALHFHTTLTLFFNAAEAISAGAPVAFTAAGLVNAQASTAGRQTVVGFATNSVSSGGLCTYTPVGLVNTSHGYAMGTVLYLGTTGGITNDPGIGTQWVQLGVSTGSGGVSIRIQDYGYVSA